MAALGALIGNRALGRVATRGRWLMRMTPTPDEVTVHQDSVTGAVVRVTTGTDAHARDLAFHVLGQGQAPPTEIAEGSAVVTVGTGKTPVVRFANETVPGSDFAGLAKVRKVLTRVVTATMTAPPPTAARRTFNFKVSRHGGIVDESFQGFEGEQAGDVHFAKHGAEFRAVDKRDYIAQAKAFGEQRGKPFYEAQIANTLIRVDPPGATRRVFVAAGKKIRTYYKWSREFASDPFTFAIYYTITHNMRIPLADVEPSILDAFEGEGVNLRAMEGEVRLRTALESAMTQEMPQDLVEAVRRGEPGLSQALAEMV